MNIQISIIFALFLFAISAVKCGDQCGVKFENEAKVLDAVKVCMGSTKMEFPPGMTSPEDAKKAMEAFEKSGFDDKCFTKCLVEKFKLVTDEGKPNREEGKKLLKNDLSPEVNKLLEELWGRCADKIEAKYKGNVSTDLCKSSAEFAFCVVQGLMDKKDQFTKLMPAGCSRK